MGFLPAYAVDGGTLPAQMLRLVAWVATSGATGIATPTDLRVTPTAVPSGAVVIMPGGAVIATRYPGGSAQQSYAVANTAADGDAVVNVPPQGSSGSRTDYLIYRIDDPQYGGQEPPDPLTAIYGRPVLVGTLDGITYPYLPLARITIPASTATITQDMITDLRQVANPRKDPNLHAHSLLPGEEDTLTSTGENGEYWPDLTGRAVWDVPEWATRMNIRGLWAGVAEPPGNCTGQVWVQVGSNEAPWRYRTQFTRFNTPNLAAGGTRATYMVADNIVVKPEIRGASVPFALRGRILTASDPSARVQLDAYTSVSLEVEFLETPT